MLDEGAEGAFGLGARSARIRVSVPEAGLVSEEPSAPVGGVEARHQGEGAEPSGSAPEKTAQAQSVTQALLGKMGLEVQVLARDEAEHILVEVKDIEGSSEVEALFRDARPPLAPSLQFLLNKIVNRFPEDRKHILVEAAGARARPERPSPRRSPREEESFDPELVALAELLDDRVSELGRVITVHPMAAGERRAIHQTLMGSSSVETMSSGEGLYRQMHVLPKGLRERGSSGRGRRGRRARSGSGGRSRDAD